MELQCSLDPYNMVCYQKIDPQNTQNSKCCDVNMAFITVMKCYLLNCTLRNDSDDSMKEKYGVFRFGDRKNKFAWKMPVRDLVYLIDY